MVGIACCKHIIMYAEASCARQACGEAKMLAGVLRGKDGSSQASDHQPCRRGAFATQAHVCTGETSREACTRGGAWPCQHKRRQHTAIAL